MEDEIMVEDPLDILGDNVVEVNNEFVIILTKNNIDKIDQEKQKTCKILKFSSELNFDEVLLTISRLESQNYSNLFIFIIEVESIEENFRGKVEILQDNLLKFNKNRQIVLQLTLKDKNATKFYYKDDNCEEFQEVKDYL